MRNIEKLIRIIAMTLTTLTVCSGAAAAQVGIEGITEPFYDAILSATVPGKIAVIHFEEGETVRTGAVLIELHKEDALLGRRRYKLVWEDKTLLEAARRRADSLQTKLDIERRKLAWENKAALESASATETLAAKDLDSTRELFTSTGSISQDEVDQKELAHKNAAADLQQLRTAEALEKVQYDIAVDQHDLQKDLDRLELQQLEISEAREKLEYEQAEEQLAMRNIVSPVDGIVEEVYLEVGANCDPRQALVRIVDISRFYFIANIEPEVAADLALEQPVQLVVEGSDKKIEGKVSFISPVVDQASGLRRIRAIFDNTDGVVPPGLAATLHTAD
ncbi:MAG: efflux RND transporter periplasmic adaptor subunit [Lentisphaeria bacterium]|nr:efflux RND transporter periplasmic adaptor subunit [Lentisphaeria bacterium]